MSDSRISEILAKLAEATVLGDPADLTAMAAIQRDLGEIVACAQAASEQLLAAAAEAAQKMLGGVVSETVDDGAEVLEIVAETITSLQRIIDGGQSPRAVRFPEQLRLPDSLVGPPSADGGSPAAATADHETELTGDPELLVDFITESREHLENVDAQLLIIDDKPDDAEALNAVFRSFHTIKGVAGFLELDEVQGLAHEAETMLDEARSGSLQLLGNVLELTFEANDALKRMVADVQDALGSGAKLKSDPGLPDLLARLKAALSCSAECDPLAEAAPGESMAASVAAPDAAVAASPVQPALAMAPTQAERADVAPAVASSVDPAPTAARPAQASDPRRAKGAGQVRETIKVDGDRLNELVDMIGELVIAETMVSQSDELSLEGATRLPGLLTHMDKITRELQQMAMSIRMVPIRSTFQRMARLARDVAKKVDKEVRFTCSGDETELDKTVVDSIGDPLVHMVRNAIDHGLESAPDRRRAGKPDAGQVHLRAFHRGGSIYIEIEDDGRGLRREAILARAVERGLVRDGEQLSDSDVYSLLFAPGFSTAKAVSDVSGRGVGLDVVKRGIEALRGRVEIRSEPGNGSVFSLQLPLTLAIIEGIVIRVGRERYVIPTLSVVRMIQPREQDIARVFDRMDMLNVGDRQLPLYRLDDLFAIEGSVQDVTQASVVIVEQDHRQYALVVDEVIGQQQIVIKPLGEALAGTEGLSGGAIMPDGRVALILDIAGLVKIAAQAGPPTTAPSAVN